MAKQIETYFYGILEIRDPVRVPHNLLPDKLPVVKSRFIFQSVKDSVRLITIYNYTEIPYTHHGSAGIRAYSG